jgi:hypothetical protein
VSGGGSLLNVGGETETGKEASADFFLHIGRGEREGVVPVLHVDDGRPDGSPVRWNHGAVSGPLLRATHGWASVGFSKSGARPKRYGPHCS